MSYGQIGKPDHPLPVAIPWYDCTVPEIICIRYSYLVAVIIWTYTVLRSPECVIERHAECRRFLVSHTAYSSIKYAIQMYSNIILESTRGV